MWRFSQAGPAGYAVLAALIGSILGLFLLGYRLREGRQSPGWQWLLGPWVVVLLGELGVLLSAAGEPSPEAWLTALRSRELALHIAGRLLLVSAAVVGMSRALLPREGASLTTWRAVLSLGAAAVGFSVMVARDASIGGPIAEAARQMGAYADLLGATALLGAAACALTAIRTSPDAEQVRAGVAIAAWGLLATLAIAAAARTHGDVALYGAALSGDGAALTQARALRASSLDVGQVVTTVIGLSALPSVMAGERSLFEVLSGRRVAAVGAMLAAAFGLAFYARFALEPLRQTLPPLP